MLKHEGVGAVEAIVVDVEMLERSRIRLKRFGDRARLRRSSFDAPLLECDSAAASLALRPGGVFVNADIVMSADAAARKQCYRIWAAHLVSRGIEERRAYEHFDEWSAEDTYFPLEEELAALRKAGFHAECVWRERPNTLLAGRKKQGFGDGRTGGSNRNQGHKAVIRVS